MPPFPLRKLQILQGIILFFLHIVWRDAANVPNLRNWAGKGFSLTSSGGITTRSMVNFFNFVSLENLTKYRDILWDLPCSRMWLRTLVVVAMVYNTDTCDPFSKASHKRIFESGNKKAPREAPNSNWGGPNFGPLLKKNISEAQTDTL